MNGQDIVMACETIISCTENLNEYNSDIDLHYVRELSEKIQNCIIDNDFNFDEISIELYQEIKYSFDDIDSVNQYILDQFNLMRNSIDYIRSFFVTE